MVDTARMAEVSPERRASRALVTQLVLSVLLIAAAPYAASMVPFEGIYTHGAYKAPYSQDPMFPVRVVLIASGLLIPILSLYFTGIAWKRRKTHPGPVLLQAGMLLCSFVVGWRNYPYWTLGVYRAYIGDAPRGDLDPSGLFPFPWFDPVWTYGVLLTYPIAVIAVPLLGFCLFLQRKRMTDGFVFGVMTSLTTTVFAFAGTPDYFTWFID